MAPELAPHLHTGHAVVAGVRVQPSGPELEHEVAAVERDLAARYRGSAFAGIERVAEVRRLFHGLRIDPTKTRPSSEALLRRVLKGKGLYRINNAVDVCNLCSLESLLPMGLYDRDAIRGDVSLQLGRTGDRYDGIRKEPVHVEGRPTLYDDLGPFGQPISDSMRTSVREATRSLYLVVYAPAAAGLEALRAITERSAGRYATFCGGRVVATSMTPARDEHARGREGNHKPELHA